MKLVPRRIADMLLGATLAVATLAPAAHASASTPSCDGRPATIVGSEGADTRVGTNGSDVIVGLGGNGLDELAGEAGDDRLRGVHDDDSVQLFVTDVGDTGYDSVGLLDAIWFS